MAATSAQQQNPPAADQRAQPAGQNGAKVGPPLNEPAPEEQRTAKPTQANAPNATVEQEVIRNFLAIGAAPDAAAIKRGQAIFTPACGFCHGTSATGGAGAPNLVRSTLVLHDKGS